MKLKIICLTFLTTACSFHTQRSFLSEMERDDSQFFNANQDFPVMAGDSGRDWQTNREMRERTPLSPEEILQNRHESALRNELAELESKQTESSAGLYERFRSKFKNISEKIYFLKLSYQEQREYLEFRGYLDTPQNYYTPRERQLAQRNSEIILGMSKQEVTGTFGRPTRVEIAGNPSYENERWVYNVNGATKYIYFESGHVGGWE
ncbi:MAG: hypothetical protein AB7I27_06830 [Bacteriovoracaceae bacterium]